MIFERFCDDSFIEIVTKSSETFLTSASADDQRHLAWAFFYESIQEVPRAINELSAIGNPSFEVVGYLYYRLGGWARKAHQMDLAQECIQSAHRYYPDYGPIVIEWGLAEMAKGHRGQAITHFQTALRDKRILHPYFFWVLIDQGLDDWVDECVDYDRMIHPEDPYLMLNVAHAYETQGRYDRAVKYQGRVCAHPSLARYDYDPWEAFERLAQKQISTLGLDEKLAGIGEDEPLSRAFWQAVKALYVQEVKPAMVNKIEEILKMPL